MTEPLVPFPQKEFDTFLQAADRAGVQIPEPLFALDKYFLDPSPLGDAADIWTNTIKEELEQIASDLENEAARTTDSWKGPASEAFRSWTHQFASEIKKPTGASLPDLARTLNDVEDAIRSFRNHLASLIIQIGGEAAAALLGGDVPALVGFVITAITSLISLLDDFDSNMNAVTAFFQSIGSDIEGIGRTVAHLGAQLANDAVLSKVDNVSQWKPR